MGFLLSGSRVRFDLRFGKLAAKLRRWLRFVRLLT